MKLKIFCRCSLFPSTVGLRTYQHPCISRSTAFWRSSMEMKKP